MPIQIVDPDRLYRKIARQLSGLIASGEFAPGQRLPAERELARQLGVSRPSLREALIALEIEGKVEVRVGAGIFVGLPKPVAVLSPLEEGEGPFELIRARRVIEGEIASIAAREAALSDLLGIRSAFEEMGRGHRAGEDTDSSDRAFHLAVAAAAHNSALVSVVQALWDQGRGAVWKQMEKHFRTPALRTANLRDHSDILQALEAHHSRAARAAMRRHLSRVEREFVRGWQRLKDCHSQLSGFPPARSRSSSSF